MPGFYARWIDNWENRLATKDRNRRVRPFDWGLEWLNGIRINGDVTAAVSEYADRAIDGSDVFFSYERPAGYQLEGSHLTFASPLATPYPENNIVHAELFPNAKSRGRAVVVLPQWNSDAAGHRGLCRLLHRSGLTALRMSLAYHDRRMPPELERADYHVSSNVGRTIHASRQSVIDARACLDWLEQQGYTKLGVLGTSLGSCIAFIAAAHDRRIRAGVFNHVSMYFSDVVWTGIATQHVRRGFEGWVTQDELRRHWGPISPAAYLDLMSGRDLKTLLIWARYDTTFLPVYSKQVLEGFRRRNLPFRSLALPCAHYTSGRFPFNWIDGLAMCRFLAHNL